MSCNESFRTVENGESPGGLIEKRQTIRLMINSGDGLRVVVSPSLGGVFTSPRRRLRLDYEGATSRDTLLSRSWTGCHL